MTLIEGARFPPFGFDIAEISSSSNEYVSFCQKDLLCPDSDRGPSVSPLRVRHSGDKPRSLEVPRRESRSEINKWEKCVFPAYGPAWGGRSNHQTRNYTHHTGHPTSICPKWPQSGPKVTPKWPRSGAKVTQPIRKTAEYRATGRPRSSRSVR